MPVFILLLVAGGGLLWFLKSGDVLSSYEKLMRADTYGGSSPEETLRLFVEALEKNDAELAAKYFILDENGSRKEWEEVLKLKKDNRELGVIAKKVLEAKPNPLDSIHPGDFKFIIVDDLGEVETTINMEINSFSGVWKIESL